MTASRATKRDRGAIRFSSALLRCGLCCRPPPLSVAACDARSRVRVLPRSDARESASYRGRAQRAGALTHNHVRASAQG